MDLYAVVENGPYAIIAFFVSFGSFVAFTIWLANHLENKNNDKH